MSNVFDHALPLLMASPLLALALGGPAQAAEAGAATFEVQTIKDVPYYEGPDADKVKHRLDLFLPRGRKDFPVLFFVHGGAWLHGDKSFLGVYSAIGRGLARHGIGAVVINYRLSPAVKHPAHVQDVARAFAWTYHHIARHGGRPDQLFVSGHSAGAHLVALLATDPRYLAAEGLTSRALRGVIAVSGVYRVPDRFLPMVFGTAADAQREASPLTYVHKDLPPFLIVYADHDFPGCGREPSEAFGKALRTAGNRAETLQVTGSDHYRIIGSAALPDSPVSEAVRRFIRDHSAGAASARME